MATIEIKAKKLDINLVSGTRPKPASITVQDFDGNPITDYIPSMTIVDVKDGKGTIKKQLTDTEGLIKVGAKTTIDLPTDLTVSYYKHYIEASLPNGWLFPLYAGAYNIINHWENGNTSVTFDYTVQLPIRAADVGYYLLDSDGNPILDDQGNPINTGNPNP